MSPFAWFGGKGNLAKWILPQVPDGKVYVEPYAGAGSMLFHRNPHGVEVLNDLHSEIVNLYRVLQDQEQFNELAHRLTYTLYAFAEFQQAIRNSECGTAVDRAWSFFVRQNMGFSGIAEHDGDWSRAFITDRKMAGTTNRWRCRLHLLDSWHERLSRVQIDNRCALECIRYWDSPDTVFYIDPPYVHETRTSSNDYKHEQPLEHHQELVTALQGIEGQAVLSGYQHEVYDGLSDWRRVELQTASHASGKTRKSGLQGAGAALAKSPRTEVLWIKQHEQEGLF